MRMDDGLENFLNSNINIGPLMQKTWESLASLKWKSPLSHGGTEWALCLYKKDYNPCDCGTTWTHGILLAIPGFLQIMCFKGTKKSHDFSLIFPTFYSLLSILKATARLQETNSLKATSFQKVIGVLKKKKAAVFLAGQTT